MDIKKIVDDACEDYKKEFDTWKDNDVILEAMYCALKQYQDNAKDKGVHELNEAQVYAVCKLCLHRIEQKRHFRVGDDFDVEACVRNVILWGVERDVEILSAFMWVPEEYKLAALAGNAIFDEAKRFVTDPYWYDPLYDVKKLYSVILECGEKLKMVKYKYNSRERVSELYRNELDESELDYDLILFGEKTPSHRMQRYLDEKFGHTTGKMSSKLLKQHMEHSKQN